MSYIKTWVERCDEHPDHQSGMVSNSMIQARMQEEIDDLREALAIQQGCCDGAAAQDAHIRREREERRAEIKNLRASNKRMRELLSAIQIDTNSDGSVWLTLSPSAYPGFIAVVYLGSQKLMAGTAALLFDELRRKALEGKP